MREIDKQVIFELYEDIMRDDFLKKEEENFDWDVFFESDYMGYRSRFLLEDFRKIKDAAPTIEGDVDTYQITLRNGSVFELIINYSNPEKSKESILKNSASASHKGNEQVANCYDQYFANLQPNEFIGVMQFVDAKNRHEMTGDVGYSAQELFATLRDGIMDSFYKTGRIKNLRGFMIRVSNKEIKRLTLYKKMIQRFLSDDFPNIFIDDITDKSSGITLLIATK